jgi:TRAP-type C4-dicarboxylate transport system substrate-binding protein
MAGLSAENQKVIRESARRAVEVEMWEANLGIQTAAWNDLAGRLKAVADPDLASFRDKMGPVIDGFVAKTGAKGKAFVDGVRGAAV